MSEQQVFLVQLAILGEQPSIVGCFASQNDAREHADDCVVQATDPDNELQAIDEAEQESMAGWWFGWYGQIDYLVADGSNAPQVVALVVPMVVA